MIYHEESCGGYMERLKKTNIDKIEKKLQEPRSEVVFPLTPTHRKELRKPHPAY